MVSGSVYGEERCSVSDGGRGNTSAGGKVRAFAKDPKLSFSSFWPSIPI